jgi:AcrR family transcriptional regulator
MPATPTSTRPAGTHHGDLRAALVEAALELVAEGGTTSITLRQVARRAGVSPGAPYHHFTDKSALLAEIARIGFEELHRTQLAVRAADPAKKLRNTVKRYVVFGGEHRAHYHVMFGIGQTHTRHPFAIDPSVRDIAGKTLDHLAGLVASVRHGATTGTSDLTRAFLIWNLAHGAVDSIHWSTTIQPSLNLATVASLVGDAAVTIAEG